MTDTLIYMDRFWDKVDKTGECWIWTASKNKKGYGRFGFGSRAQLAHRVSWLLSNGEIPDGMLACHTCDNPPCVNPSHLWLGTQKDNVVDMSSKGRHGCTKKTHCVHGHEYTIENTGTQKTAKNGFQRYCKECKRIQTSKWHREERVLRRQYKDWTFQCPGEL